jgi:hypothetical protein
MIRPLMIHDFSSSQEVSRSRVPVDEKALGWLHIGSVSVGRSREPWLGLIKNLAVPVKLLDRKEEKKLDRLDFPVS